MNAGVLVIRNPRFISPTLIVIGSVRIGGVRFIVVDLLTS
jgi:hypothetical protein